MNDHRAADGRSRRRSSDRRAGTIGRRHLLSSLAAGGTATIAGCFGGDRERREPDVDGRAWRTTVHGNVDDLRWGSPSGRLGAIAFDVGFVRDPASGDLEYVLADAVEESETSVSITLAEGLEWSNGEPLTAAGIGRWLFMYRAGSSRFRPVPEIRAGATPRSTWEAITNVEWTDRTLTLEGAFEYVESPLVVTNAYLGRRPAAYSEDLWDAFRDAYDDTPWESEATRQRVVELIDDAIWNVPERYVPDAGIQLEDEYDGAGWEAAFSGLWYPYRRDRGHLYFTVNETHPFADRVSYDELVWKFADNPNAPLEDVRAGAVDGTMRTEVPEDFDATLPEDTTSFPGPAGAVTVLTINHGAPHLQERDVRAALQYAIDRAQLAETLATPTIDPVAVPGADLQRERWLSESFRNQLRSYPHGPERAAALLERAGFERDGDAWLTPSGDRFELELLTTIDDSAFERTIASQLEAFGIDASYHAAENANYQERLTQGYFAATGDELASPNAAGLRRTRTADIVRRPTYRAGAPDSTYLGPELSSDEPDGVELVASDDRAVSSGLLAFDDLDALRSITVAAPPLGEPDGELREWPYPYHAAMVDGASDLEEKIEHARRCTWIYNYQVPVLELAIERPRIVHRTEGWELPEPDDPVWQRVGHGGGASGLWAALGSGRIDAE